MTYENIYQKFMIEYDKAGITSSYPSLTEYEAATILDKAYLALIAQKVTGNNVRRSTVESDVKAVSDLKGLITTDECAIAANSDSVVGNRRKWSLPTGFLYFIGGTIRNTPMKLIPHESAEKFFYTPYNNPWIKIPVCYIEGDCLFTLEEYKQHYIDSDVVNITYIKEPSKFANMQSSNMNTSTTFECNDSMVEELISLAVTFALENVESSRLNTKLNTKGLEA